MKAKTMKTPDDQLDVLAWLDSMIPDTTEMRAIEEEERAKYNLAAGLRRAREAAGHTQTTLALELEVRQSLVSKWERIDHNHTLETLLSIMQATGANLVLGIEVNGELIPVTPAAERCVLLSETTHANLQGRAADTGLTVREILLAPMAATETTVPTPHFENSYEPRSANVTRLSELARTYSGGHDDFQKAALGGLNR